MLFALVATLFAAAPAHGASMLQPPPSGDIYHAAYPDFTDAEDKVEAKRIKRFERLAGKDITWAYMSNNWWRGRIRFPAGDVAEVADAGRLPFIRLMARSGWRQGADPNFSMESIASGEWDPELREWCADAAHAIAKEGTPLLAEFGTEVNGDWFPWNGRWNGGGKTGGYGDPSEADGPETFRDAYRRIVDLCAEEGANEITWFFHVDAGGSPRASWNRIEQYYPGDAYVDWLGISCYGLLVPGEGAAHAFRKRMDSAYEDVAALSAEKPIAVLEYGYAEASDMRRKADWIRDAIADVASGRWERIAALSWWHEQWRNGDGSISDLQIDSSRRSLRAYRRGVARDAFVSEPVFGPG